MTKQGDLENFDKIIANINLEIAKKIDNNLDRLIEAFTIYYGIDKRKQIESAIKNTYFVWYIDKDLDVIHDLLMDSSIVSRTTITYEILKMLNIKINKLDIDCDFKNISSLGRKNILNNGKVYKETYTAEDIDYFMTEHKGKFYLFPPFGTNETTFWTVPTRSVVQKKAQDFLAEDILLQL